MISHDEAQGTLFGTARVVAIVGERVQPNPALLDRAAFVQYHVGEIVKKLKTVESHRSKAKTLLERANAVGDTGAGEEAKEHFLMAEQSQMLVNQHLAALTARTRIEP